MKISALAANVAMDADNPRGGINLHFNLAESGSVQLSEGWSIAGWNLRFVFLPPHHTLELEAGTHYLKVIIGKLANLGRGCFAEDFAVRTTRLESTRVLAGPSGLLCALATETADMPENIHTMADCQFSGPLSEALQWQSFQERFGAFTDYFSDLDNHMANGFHLLDSEGVEITYVNFWTCGSNGDVSTHNHSQAPSELGPAFAEVHLVLNNGTGTAGMYESEGPDSDHRRMHVMNRGDEHGPFFEHQKGVPVMLENGAIKYPWHGWQSGYSEAGLQAYDLVAAFEISPGYAVIPPVGST